MALERKTIKTIFIIAGILISLAIILYFVLSGKDKVKKPNEPVPPNSPKPTWQEESFPLNVGMYGEKIRKVQEALGFTGNDADGKLGTNTKGAITSAGYKMPLTEIDYNSIVNEGSGQNAYANKDGVKVYNKDGTLFKTAKKNDWILKVSGKKGAYTDKWITAYYGSGDKFVDINDVYLN